MEGADDILLVVLGFAASTGHCVLFARQLWKRGRCARCPQLKLRLPNQRQDQFDRSVSAQVRERLSEAVQGAAHSVGALMLIMSLAYYTFPDNQAMYMERQQQVLLLANISVLCLRVCPKWVLIRTMPLFYIVFMACLGGYEYFSDFSNVFSPLRAMAAGNLVRLGCSYLFGHFASSLVCNLSFSAMNTFMIWRLRDELGTDIGDISSIFAFELIWGGAIVVFSSRRRKALAIECSEKLKNKGLTIESSAMTELLNLVCDVVVELDADLNVVEHVPRLSAMLGTNMDTRGLALTRYMSRSTDRNRFRHRLRGKLDGGDGASEPDAMNVTFRDSMTNEIPVEIFFVSFQGLGNGKNCFVGIREIADQPVGRLPPLRPMSKAAFDASAARQSGTSVGRPGRGTNPILESQPLNVDANQLTDSTAQRAGEEGGSASSVKTAVTTASGWRHVDDSMQLTTLVAKKMSLLEMLMQWNIAIPRKSCCAWHAEVHELRSMMKALVQSPCDPEFRLCGEFQCKACGLVLGLDDEEEALLEHACSAPGGPPSAEPPPSPQPPRGASRSTPSPPPRLGIEAL